MKTVVGQFWAVRVESSSGRGSVLSVGHPSGVAAERLPPSPKFLSDGFPPPPMFLMCSGIRAGRRAEPCASLEDLPAGMIHIGVRAGAGRQRRPRLANCRPNLAHLGPTFAKHCRSWGQLGHICQTLANRGRCRRPAPQRHATHATHALVKSGRTFVEHLLNFSPTPHPA